MPILSKMSTIATCRGLPLFLLHVLLLATTACTISINFDSVSSVCCSAFSRPHGLSRRSRSASYHNNKFLCRNVMTDIIHPLRGGGQDEEQEEESSQDQDQDEAFHLVHASSVGFQSSTPSPPVHPLLQGNSTATTHQLTAAACPKGRTRFYLGDTPQPNTDTALTIVRTVLTEASTTQAQYNWKNFFPRVRTTTSSRISGLSQVARWFITGSSPYTEESNVEAKQNFASLARMLILLRTYESQFVTHEDINKDGIVDDPVIQREVLSDITTHLYSSGTPTWVLEQIMERVAEGLTGKRNVQFLLLPRRCFIFYPDASSTTAYSNYASKATRPDMFRMDPGFDICKLGAIEQVAVRLASFASNTKSIERLNLASVLGPSRQELAAMKDTEIQRFKQQPPPNDKAGLAKEILDLASSTYGLFFFLNSPELQTAVHSNTTAATMDNDNEDEEDPFWQVQDSTRSLFTWLAATEASQNLAEAKRKYEKQLYSPQMVNLFRILSSAGACAVWFGGSLHDMIASGILAILVAYIGSSNLRRQLAFEERVLTEVVASLCVGVISGVLAIRWPDKFCFGAIAVASIMELLQGFKVVYAVIEVMSKNIVTGTSRLLEGILFTGLISYSLKFGLDFAFRLMMGGAPAALDYANMLESANGINGKFFPFILPFATTAWSGLFRPNYADLPLMAFHGMLAFALNWAGASMFVAAMCVTFSAGIVSRFTGREALGNTLSGLYALVPGVYMVRSILAPSRVNFIESVLLAATTIGLGGWAGTILCSPTILGKSSWSFGRERDTSKKQQALLYF